MTDSVNATHWLALAVAIRVMFFGLVRPGEYCRLHVNESMVAAGQRTAHGGKVLLLRIVRAKNKRFYAKKQFIVIRDSETIDWFVWFAVALKPRDLLFVGGPGRLRFCFKVLLNYSGLSALRLTPGCLRSGGATYFFLEDMSLGALQFLGRWRSALSLQIYVQEAVSLLVVCQLSPSEERRVEEVVLAAASLWTSPPSALAASLAGQRRAWKHLHAQR